MNTMEQDYLIGEEFKTILGTRCSEITIQIVCHYKNGFKRGYTVEEE